MPLPLEVPPLLLTQSLKKTAAYKTVYAKGKSYANPCLAVYALRREGPDILLGLVAGKKVGGSVVRNRVKRRLREGYRQLEPGLPPGYALVLVARPAAAQASFARLRDSLAGLLRRHGLLGAPHG